MKKGILVFTLATAILCAEETNLSLPTLDTNETATKIVVPETPEEEAHNFNRRFIPYVKLGPDLLNVGTTNQFTPNLGFGIRSESNFDAVDASFSYSSKRMQGDEDAKEEFQVFCPKLLYQRYLDPMSPSSFFYGGGASWGVSKCGGKSFNGLYGDLSFGYEKGRDSNIRQIIQCNLTQPVLAYTQKGGLPTPSLELSYSLGF